MESGEEVASPVYAVYYPGDIAKSPRNVFLTLKEAVKFANSPEGKSNGARFNRFGTPKQAMEFFASGECRSPQCPTTTPPVPFEPVIPHPSLSRLQMNDFKKAIEKGTIEAVTELIDTNPRFLVNTSGDTAAIVMEGFRFNALHIAARHGKVDVVERILHLVNDTKFLADLYGTTEDDARFRAENIVASYLNTPDKGNCDTPLHIAAKFGHVDVVRALVDQPLMDKHFLNKEGQTALEVACARYTGSDKRERKAEIELLLGGFFVSLYRSADNSTTPKILKSERFPEPTLCNDNQICSPVLPDYKLAAYAGPFGSKSKAEEFLNAWVNSEKHLKLTDTDKGYERVGRALSTKHKVKWAESWCFLNRLVDLRTLEGLSLLNEYLGGVRRRESMSPVHADQLRKKLDFDDEDDNPELSSCLTPAEDERNDDEGEEFEDASETIEENVLNDSLASLTDRLGALCLRSPITPAVNIEERLPPQDLEEFFTPPATPPPVFLLEYPTKVDNDVMIALADVPQEQINQYSHVRLFMEKLNRLTNKVRSEWPALDSPRRVKISRRFLD